MYGNRYTQNPKEYACPCCESVDQFTGSYLSYVKLSDFCTNPDKYIESAYEKSQHLDSSKTKNLNNLKLAGDYKRFLEDSHTAPYFIL